ncbi:LacI family DNA-binding transcriptional regulator [Streptomyces chiangmaiensis]|uniref:LacI family DNA-binding transcriptional regulator n=1 Tax=Streptomyces chiangmaiensis TaxID=766497 RepID=A0ABU7FSF3_9ACTN|nr:LacI family DNA-binding transcriptional regulator [Streptomyces chiangmaiensis]MED7826702.1 LacI family DNA-binding transcriptional regulator [Streptomyces chiangmaiensis]
MAEVARAAHVSLQTVSNALNAPERVRADTLARVLAAIDKLGYQPNQVARSLRTRRTRHIGYRLDPDRSDTASVLQDRFLHALTTAAESAGHRVLLFSSGGISAELTCYEDMLRTGSVDGFVLSGIDPGDPRPAWLAERGAAFACFGRPDPDSNYLWVDVDGAAGTQAAVDHLVAAGHREIGFLGWSSTSGPGEQRRRGWLRALQRHGLRPDHHITALDTLQDGTRAALELLGRAPTITAIVAASDTFALGCYAAARSVGREIGRELAVIGVDDSPTASLVTPALTSVRQPLEEVAKEVMSLLVAKLKDQRVQHNGIVLAPSLMIRESA